MSVQQDQERIEEEIDRLKADSPPESTGLEQTAKTYSEETELTWEMAHAFIQAIYAYPDGRREIRWKFKDIAK